MVGIFPLNLKIFFDFSTMSIFKTSQIDISHTCGQYFDKVAFTFRICPTLVLIVYVSVVSFNLHGCLFIFRGGKRLGTDTYIFAQTCFPFLTCS